MDLSECLDLSGLVSAPPFRDEPEEEWVSARDTGAIPIELFDLYRATSYLSASALCGFDTEYQRLISTYFGRVMRSLLDCLDEAAKAVAIMREETGQLYTPIKRIRGDNWDRSAGRRFRATFRLFLIDLVGALDALTELVALVLPSGVPGLKLAKGSFGSLRAWLKKPQPQASGLVTPVQHHVEQLHAVLSPHITADDPKDDWFELLRIYRNKVTHLGHQSWLQLGLQASDEEIYYFLPRTWPFIPERHASVGEPSADLSNTRLREHLLESLVHVDLLTYSNQVVAKIQRVVASAVKVLLEAYIQMKRIDEMALAPQLEAATEHCAFMRFPSAG